MSLSSRDVVPLCAYPPADGRWTVVGVSGALDAHTAPAWGERLRAACDDLAAGAADHLVAPVLLVDLRTVRLLSAAAMSQLTSARDRAGGHGVELVVLLEPGGWAHRMLRATGLAERFSVFGVDGASRP